MFLKMGYGVYFFFASLMVLSVPFVYFLLPETKSIPLESMDRLFEIRPVRKANAILVKELRAQEEDFRRKSVGGVDVTVENAKHDLAERNEEV